MKWQWLKAGGNSFQYYTKLAWMKTEKELRSFLNNNLIYCANRTMEVATIPGKVDLLENAGEREGMLGSSEAEKARIVRLKEVFDQIKPLEVYSQLHWHICLKMTGMDQSWKSKGSFHVFQVTSGFSELCFSPHLSVTSFIALTLVVFKGLLLRCQISV